MKKVRFETPTKLVMDPIQSYECHSPRPFVERQIVQIDCNINQPKPLVFTNDPVQMFENSDSSPYPTVNKTHLNSVLNIRDKKVPSSELDLSLLDISQPRQIPPSPKINDLFRTEKQGGASAINSLTKAQVFNGIQSPERLFTSIENRKTLHPPNIRTQEDDFFLRKDNLGKLSYTTLNQQFNQLSLNKQDNPFVQKSKLIKFGTMSNPLDKENFAPPTVEANEDCRCHGCIRLLSHIEHNNITKNLQHKLCKQPDTIGNNCHPHRFMTPPRIQPCNCNMQIVQPICQCNLHNSPPVVPQNAVDKKTWAIEKYEKSQKGESLEVEKQTNVSKEKREPTVADLFKIIKLQNEQLQLLQEKVDNFISAHNHNVQEKHKLPIQNYVTEHMAVQTVNSEEHKISIGVMTSFEMVRTSTVINKEVMKQCEAQIQCNRSQISIKEVISKKQSGNLNFLDGIPPVSKDVGVDGVREGNAEICLNTCEDYKTQTVMEDKTLNELSLYNVQVDNATTPLMSPDQSLYLDIRDYSESDSGSDDQSNVGWTYYNKVMTHVNGMLQDSDMPSSASAMYRQTKQKCVQIDKSNVSAAKRVTFVPLGVKQQPVATPTDTSLKMNQLAAKYLKSAPYSHTPSPRATEEMSFATKNYMERHKLLQGQQYGQNTPYNVDIPKFLDITALKQQPKFI